MTAPSRSTIAWGIAPPQTGKRGARYPARRRTRPSTSVSPPAEAGEPAVRTPICAQVDLEFPIFAFSHCRDVLVPAHLDQQRTCVARGRYTTLGDASWMAAVQASVV